MRPSRKNPQLINKAEAEEKTQVMSPRLRVKPRERSRMPRGTRLSASMNAQGDADLFKQVFSAYQKAPEVTRKRIYLETIGKVLDATER